MADRDAEFTLSATDKTGPAVRSAADGFEHVGDKADKAKRKINDLGDETGHLARKMAEAKLAAMALAREFDRTGESKIVKDFQKANAELAKLTRLSKSLKIEPPDLKKDGPDGFLGKLVQMGKDAGVIAGDATVNSFADAFQALPGPAKAGLVGALVGSAAIAAPVIIGVVESAVLAGIATGGIAGGLIYAAKNPAVAAAYSQLGSNINRQLEQDTKPFATTLLALAPKFGAAFDREEPTIQRIAAGLATSVGPVVDDILEGIHRIMPSIERASMVGGRILQDVGAQIPMLLQDVGDLFDAFSEGGEGASAGLQLVIYQIRGLVELMAFGAHQAAPFLWLFGEIAKFTGTAGPEFGKQTSVLVTNVKEAGSAAGLTAAQYAQLSGALGNTADQARMLDDAFSSLFGQMMNQDEANLRVNEGLLKIRDTLKDNKKTLDQSTADGAENAKVILSQVQALDAKRQADIAAGNGTVEATQQANAAYSANVQALRAVLIQMGLNAGEVDNLIAKYQSIPKNITTNVTTIYRTQGTPPGYSDQLTGHSRTGSQDYGALDGWYAASFAAAEAGRFAMAAGGGSSGPHQPPVEVHSEHSFTVMLDGTPFQAYSIRTTRAAERRQAWRNRTGSR